MLALLAEAGSWIGSRRASPEALLLRQASSALVQVVTMSPKHLSMLGRGSTASLSRILQAKGHHASRRWT